MRIICLFTFLAVAALMSTSAYAGHHEWRFAYFYINDGMVVESNTPVDWTEAGAILDEDQDIAISSIDPTKIIIRHPGFYRIDYSLTLFSEDAGTANKIQFSIRVDNGFTVADGSTYAAANAGQDVQYELETHGEPQLNGQLVLPVEHRNTSVQLWNQSEFDAVLVDDAGTDDPTVWGRNVCASILIRKLADLD